MSRNQRTYLIAATVFLLYLGIVFAIAFLVPSLAANRWLFIALLGIVGLIAAIAIVIYKRKAIDPSVPTANEIDTANLAALVQSAETRMKQGKGAAKSLGAMPLVYILGDENAGKTQTVLQSGLDAELLAGQVNRDGLVPPTQLANIWYTSAAAIVEAGGTLLRQPGLWYRLVSLTAPSKLGAALSKGALQSTRAAIVCVSTERILAANSAEAVRALGQALNEQLRLLSKALGITLPVYVLFTKLDTIPSFADYVANLTDQEIKEAFGSLLAQPQSGAGLYAETATTQISQRFDELCYSLAEFRLEILARGGDPAALARAYEFPRELRKLRSNIVDLLVEAGRPSQLGVNPFLRGFYFIGMRARVVEDSLAPAPYAQPAQASADASATRVFSFNPSAAPAVPTPVVRAGSRRVPQWVFLAHLFPRVFLADRGALETSRSSTRVNVVKRLLIASVAACIFLCFIAFTISWFNNNALEGRLRTAAALPAPSVAPGPTASITDLENLEKLRAIFVEVAAYKKDGPPFSYTWGLYPGDKLYNSACAAYGSHFRALLLQPTQQAILARLASLPISTPPAGDYSSAYRPLRAYLITTSYPTYSSLDFEPDALQEAWTSDRPTPPEAADISLAQFKTYSANLNEPASCLARFGGAPQSPTVAHAQQYLAQFQGSEQVYISMKNAANAKNRGVRFDEKFPQAKPYIVDPYLVEGAFTRGGYDFMMDAIAHPEKYASGEEWVLGKQTGPAIPLQQLAAPISARYQADFINAWRTYLKSAHVVNGAGFVEAQAKLHQLDGNQSPLLSLFQLLSQNTATPNPAFSQPFQAPQSVVPPPAVALPLGTPYIAGLGALDSALNNYNNTPGHENNPAASDPVLAAALDAEKAVNAMHATFTADNEAHLDDTTEALLLAPIRSVAELAKKKPAEIAGGGANEFCKNISQVLRKFPFNPDSSDEASMQEANSIFGQGQAIAQFAQSTKMVTLQGSFYVAAQGSTVVPSKPFLSFLNSAQTVTNALFPLGGGPPSIAFSLTQEASPGLPVATLDIDGTRLAEAGQQKQFVWKASPASNVTVTSGTNTVPSTGQWSLFRFAYSKRSGPGRIEYIFQANDRPIPAPGSGVPLDYKFDVSGPGAQLLNPGFMKNSLRCPTKVAQ